MKDLKQLFIQDYEAETERITGFFRTFFDGCPRKRAILGFSGGIDSTVATALCCREIGPENVDVVLMPAPNSSRGSVDDAFKQAKVLGIPCENIHYKPIAEKLKTFGFDEESLQQANLQIGNTAARIRMATLFQIADEVGAVVIGTENQTEHLLGYFTIGGDEVSIIEPFQHLYKTEVRGLADYLGNIIPEIRNKKPSAELWDGQTDEDELGFTYHDADIVLAGIMADVGWVVYGVTTAVATKVIARVNYTEFKRERPFHLERRQ
ncbi:MAG: NAD(+) synthase [Patescibacteria group bacterium]|nr:NAD(+) synthase [Patescibacteria group bacterium]